MENHFTEKEKPLKGKTAQFSRPLFNKIVKGTNQKTKTKENLVIV